MVRGDGPDGDLSRQGLERCQDWIPIKVQRVRMLLEHLVWESEMSEAESKFSLATLRFCQDDCFLLCEK